MIPLNLFFDGAKNVQGSNVVHLPKLNQGAPYSFGLKVRYEDDSYRSWADIVEIRWKVKLRPADKHELLELYLSAGNFVVQGDQLNFVVKAVDWDGVVLPQSVNYLETDVPFTFVMEILDAEGKVLERFAHGSGLIAVDLNT